MYLTHYHLYDLIPSIWPVAIWPTTFYLTRYLRERKRQRRSWWWRTSGSARRSWPGRCPSGRPSAQPTGATPPRRKTSPPSPLQRDNRSSTGYTLPHHNITFTFTEVTVPYNIMFTFTEVTVPYNIMFTFTEVTVSYKSCSLLQRSQYHTTITHSQQWQCHTTIWYPLLQRTNSFQHLCQLFSFF